jgi:hypothetical protein
MQKVTDSVCVTAPCHIIFFISKVHQMRMEFVHVGGRKNASLPWNVKILTFDELIYQAKVALSGFYVSNENSIWPRQPNAPEEVRIVDSDGVEIVTYTIRDLLKETQRTLIPAEPLDDVGPVLFNNPQGSAKSSRQAAVRRGAGRNSRQGSR